jgi:hypothetical protein
MKRRSRRQQKLWAVLLSMRHGSPRQLICAPSLEAARASMGEDDDLVRWGHSVAWHAEECAEFLESYRPQRAQA